MAGLSFTVELVGANAGKTMLIAKRHQFVNGRMSLSGAHETVEHALKYLSYFSAYAIGTEEHAKAVAAWKARQQEKPNGVQRQVLANTGSGSPTGVLSRNESAGQGAAAVSTTGREGAASGNAGSAGIRSAGRGLPDAGLSDGAESGPGASVSGLDKLRLTIYRLDPHNDEHWTEDGLPSLDAISQVYPGVTRADVSDIAPGFNREAAQQTAGI